MVVLSFLVYTLLSLTIGGALLYASIYQVDFSLIEATYELLYTDWMTRSWFGLIGVLIILFWMRFIKGKNEKASREKTIAFQTGNGEVTISLLALEDMLKKQLVEFKHLKEIRPQIIVSKKRGKKEIHVVLRVILESCTNVPEITSSVQENVRARLQDLLGIEEKISVDISIRKIIFASVPCKINKNDTDVISDVAATSVPYRDF